MLLLAAAIGSLVLFADLSGFLVLLMSLNFVPFVVLFSSQPNGSGLRGATLVDAGGLERRVGVSTERIPWEQVEKIAFVPRPIVWPPYRLVVFRRHARALTLPAPVIHHPPAMVGQLEQILAWSGGHRHRIVAEVPGPPRMAAVVAAFVIVPLMVAFFVGSAIMLTIPWKQPWWPTRDEASRLPSACGLFDRATLARAVPGAGLRGDPTEKSATRRYEECTWNVGEPPPEMVVEFELIEHRVADRAGASERAHGLYESATSSPAYPSPLDGVGDEARMRVSPSPDETVRIGVHARKANVLITVRRNAVEGTEEQVTRETARLTRIAIGKIVLE